MVHPGGFEPLTNRFVAEYSIQLSYGCTNETRPQVVLNRGRLKTNRFVAEYSIQLSYGCINENGGERGI